nr:succinate--hydroxymethylglutarate CoA-transferase-like isoform X3 [Pocillopora verrucosa]
MRGPLSGVRVLDMTRILAGPFTTMLLGDLGAEIIKIEKPESGDDTRSWAPPFCENESTYFLSINRNKKSIAVNIKDPKGTEIVRKLASKCDVLVENYLPGKLDKVGLGYDQLKTSAPSLIYCSITGFGRGGPYDQRPGYDVMVSGIGGLMHITGPEIAMLSHVGTSYLNAGFETGRYGTAHHSIVPYQAFKTCDGHFLVGAGNDGLFRKLCKLLGLDNLADDPLYATNAARVENRHKLLPLLKECFQQRGTKEWAKAFEGSGIPCGPINNIKAVFEDPQVKYKKMVQELEHPTAGKIRIPGPAVEYNGQTCQGLPRAPPLLGQHTHEILTNLLEYSNKEISTLEHDGIIECHLQK